jgi:hypothetical protein
MITVELRAVPEGAHDYMTVATLNVADDGTVTTHDPDGYLPLDVKAMVVDDQDQITQVGIDDDAATYARNLDSILRTGYVVPVVVHDDGTPVGRSAQP